MPPLFMDTRSKFNCTGSVSGEDTSSSDKGEQESHPRGQKRCHRQEKNRVAARKTRKKQTERADELHEELQSLEHSNTALEKEIDALRKDFQHYTTALESHKPFCRLHGPSLRLPASASPTPAVAPITAALLNGSSPSSSFTGTLHALDKPASSHLALLLASPVPTTSASGPPTRPGPPGLTSTRLTNVPLTPVPAGTASDLPPVTSLTTSALSRSGYTFRLSSSVKTTNVLPRTDPAVLPASTQTVAPPPYPGLVNVQSLPNSNHLNARANLDLRRENIAVHGLTNAHQQLHSGQSSGFLTVLLPLSSQSCVAPQTNPGRSPAPDFALSSSQHYSTNTSASLLSRLIVPGPLIVPQTASSYFTGHVSGSGQAKLSISHSLPNLSTASDPLDDPLSDLLEHNPWLLENAAGWDS